MEAALNELRWRCSTAAGCLRGSFLAVGSPQEEITRRGAAAIGLALPDSSRTSRRCGSAAEVRRDGMRAKSGRGDKPRTEDAT